MVAGSAVSPSDDGAARLSNMSTRWYNPRVPQTLAISQFLLYFDAFWAVVALLAVGAGPAAFILLIAVGAYVYGAWGIANEKKAGYKVAVAASFLPLAARVVESFDRAGGPLSNLTYILLGAGIIGALFEYALIGLLLHPQSREHQKVWFD